MKQVHKKNGIFFSKFWRSLAFWITCILIHSKLANFVYRKGMSINLIERPPLYDLVQESFPNLQAYRIIPEILHVIPIIALVICIVWFKHKDCLCEFLVKHGILMFLRSIFFSVTLLPDSSGMCQLSNHLGGCFDLIFSGHSTISFLCTLLLCKHYPLHKEIKWSLHLNNLLTCFLIILCRNHYTIDVVISLVMTYFVWNF
jgi:hypothetical protein